jgi:thiamine biosynthesis protein ThiI
MADSILVRYGEVFLKKGNRARFLRILKQNLDRCLAARFPAGGITVRPFHGRYEVLPAEGPFDEAPLAAAMAAVTSTFGIASASPVVRTGHDLETIAAVAVELVRNELEAARINTFKVQTNRAWKRFPLISPEINASVGERIVNEFKLPAKMKAPDLTVGIEIYEKAVYLFAHTTTGPGGLPVGSSGRALLLLSGGIDSPVAGWMIAKRGCSVGAVHFHSYPYTSQKSLSKVTDIAERLAPWLGPVPLVQIRLTPVQEYLRDQVPNDKLVLFYRRAMIRLATRVARTRKATALVTGESLGQVASQTLHNLHVIGEATPLLILRPLIAMDKEETVRLARRIGTFDLSIQPHTDCCSLFLPPHPDTKGDVEKIKAIESRLDRLAQLEDEVFEAREETLCAGS